MGRITSAIRLARNRRMINQHKLRFERAVIQGGIAQTNHLRLLQNFPKMPPNFPPNAPKASPKIRKGWHGKNQNGRDQNTAKTD